MVCSCATALASTTGLAPWIAGLQSDSGARCELYDQFVTRLEGVANKLHAHSSTKSAALKRTILRAPRWCVRPRIEDEVVT
jgi:hypothetical protein